MLPPMAPWRLRGHVRALAEAGVRAAPRARPRRRIAVHLQRRGLPEGLEFVEGVHGARLLRVEGGEDEVQHLGWRTSGHRSGNQTVACKHPSRAASPAASSRDGPAPHRPAAPASPTSPGAHKRSNARAGKTQGGACGARLTGHAAPGTRGRSPSSCGHAARSAQ